MPRIAWIRHEVTIPFALQRIESLVK